jgi:hypothetical protein
MLKRSLLVAACVLTCGQALAQGGPGQGDVRSTIIGAWQGVTGNPGDPIQVVKVFAPDGQFVIMTLNQGRPLKYWGSYNAQQVGPNAVRVAYNFAGYAPQQFCMQGGGCFPSPPPRQGMSDTFQAAGNGTLYNDGSMLQRGPVPPAVTQPMPTTFMLPGAPMMAPPGIAQAPTPVIKPYTTPNGARYNSQPAQDFIYQRLRGCSPDYGTQHSYTNCQ